MSTPKQNPSSAQPKGPWRPGAFVIAPKWLMESASLTPATRIVALAIFAELMRGAKKRPDDAVRNSSGLSRWHEDPRYLRAHDADWRALGRAPAPKVFVLGYSSKQIAKRCGLSERTVDRAYRELNAKVPHLIGVYPRPSVPRYFSACRRLRDSADEAGRERIRDAYVRLRDEVLPAIEAFDRLAPAYNPNDYSLEEPEGPSWTRSALAEWLVNTRRVGPVVVLSGAAFEGPHARYLWTTDDGKPRLSDPAQQPAARVAWAVLHKYLAALKANNRPAPALDFRSHAKWAAACGLTRQTVARAELALERAGWIRVHRGGWTGENRSRTSTRVSRDLDPYWQPKVAPKAAAQPSIRQQRREAARMVGGLPGEVVELGRRLEAQRAQEAAQRAQEADALLAAHRGRLEAQRAQEAAQARPGYLTPSQLAQARPEPSQAARGDIQNPPTFSANPPDFLVHPHQTDRYTIGDSSLDSERVERERLKRGSRPPYAPALDDETARLRAVLGAAWWDLEGAAAWERIPIRQRPRVADRLRKELGGNLEGETLARVRLELRALSYELEGQLEVDAEPPEPRTENREGF
jgi:hypothetical protein